MSKRISLSNMTIPEALRALADEYDVLWTEYEGSYSGSYKGAYNPETEYTLYDRVHLFVNEMVYLAKVKNVGEDGFIVGIPPNEPDSLYWEVITVNFLIRGTDGLDGEKGDKGEKGERGLTGETGLTGERGASVFYINLHGQPETTTMADGAILGYGKPVKTNDLLVDILGNVFIVTIAGIEGGEHHVIYRTNIKGATGERGASIFSINLNGSPETITVNDGGITGYGKPVKTNDFLLDLIGNIYVITNAGSEGGIHNVLYITNIKGQDSVVQVYRHHIQYGAQLETGEKIISYIDILNRSSTPFTLSALSDYLVANTYMSVYNPLACSGIHYLETDTNIGNTIMGVYSANGKLNFYKVDRTTVSVPISTTPNVFSDKPVLI